MKNSQCPKDIVIDSFRKWTQDETQQELDREEVIFIALTISIYELYELNSRESADAIVEEVSKVARTAVLPHLH